MVALAQSYKAVDKVAPLTRLTIHSMHAATSWKIALHSSSMSRPFVDNNIGALHEIFHITRKNPSKARGQRINAAKYTILPRPLASKHILEINTTHCFSPPLDSSTTQ
jgi:hypothetical protein